MNENKYILRARSYLKTKIINKNKVFGFNNERKQLFEILLHTIKYCESNSVLLIGPRNVGKTLLVEDIFQELLQDGYFHRNAILVQLHGLIHTDDRLALKSMTSQMDLENAVEGRVFGTFADNLSFLLACLKSGQKETAKSLIVVIDEFDLFCLHHNQTLLYNLFDISQSAQTPICILGITSRLDIIELFEKRVKSRFSHRQIFLFTNQETLSDSDLNLKKVEYWLKLRQSNAFSTCYVTKWNKSIDQLLISKKFLELINRLNDIGSFERVFKNILLLVISKLTKDNSFIRSEDIENELKLYEKDDIIILIHNLSVLELCLLIAMNHHSEIYDIKPFNFEMIFLRYSKFINSNSNIQTVQRTVVIKAFEHLQNIELITPISSNSSRLQKEYQLFKLLVTSNQIMDSIKSYHGLPTEVIQWASNSLG